MNDEWHKHRANAELRLKSAAVFGLDCVYCITVRESLSYGILWRVHPAIMGI